MGDKIKFIILASLLWHTCSFANIEYNYSISQDESVKVQKNSITYKPKVYGITVNKTDYSLLNTSYSSSGILLSIDKKSKDIEIKGDLGIGQKDNSNFLLGSMSAIYNYTKNIKLGTELIGDMVDSPKSLSNNITYIGLIPTLELEKEKYGILGGLKYLNYKDNNFQKGYFLKPWINIVTGLNFYLTLKDHQNTIQSSYYSSPPHYYRRGYGFNGGFVINDIRFGGFVEKSSIQTDYHYEKTSTWQLRINTALNNNTKLGIKIGRDKSHDTEFDYRYFIMQLMINY